MSVFVRLFAEHIGGMCIGLMFSLPTIIITEEPIFGALVFLMISTLLIQLVPERGSPARP